MDEETRKELADLRVTVALLGTHLVDLRVLAGAARIVLAEVAANGAADLEDLRLRVLGFHQRVADRCHSSNTADGVIERMIREAESMIDLMVAVRNGDSTR